jgi:hypothetical protein
MTIPLRIECEVHLQDNGRNQLRPGRAPEPLPVSGRVPRIARLLALALRLDQLLREGVIRDYRHLAELGQISRAQASHIMNLLCLAPDIQEQILFLPRTERGRDPIHLRHVQPLTRLLDWGQQRRRWRQFYAAQAANASISSTS